MSRMKRFVFGGCLLLLLALAAELTARLGLALVRNRTGGLPALLAGKHRVASDPSEVGLSDANAAARLSEGISLHPFIGFVQTPRPVGAEWMDLHHLPINDFGFIDDKPTVQKRSPGRRIVGITGGSVAFFFGSEGQESLRRELSALPGFAGREIVFVRIALGGFKEPQQLGALAYILAMGGEFDYLINIDGFNEVALHPVEGRPFGANPSYPRSWPHLVSAGVDPARLKALGAQAFWASARQRWAQQMSSAVVDYSGFSALLWKAGDRWLLGRLQAAKSNFLTETGSSEFGFSALGPRTELTNDAEMFQFLADLWANSSTQLARLCKANQIAYYHFLQPNQYLPGSKSLGEIERAIAIDVNSPYSKSVEAGFPLLRAAGEELVKRGENFFDLTQIFVGSDEIVYRDSCCHLNLEGNRRLAKAVATALSSAPRSSGSVQGTTASQSE